MTEARLTLIAAFSDYARRRSIRKELSRLDERGLEDIGMNRADVDIRFG